MKKCMYLSGLVILLNACGLVDNFSEEPMYLEINSAQLKTAANVSNSNKIQDVWAYVDGFNVGVFELPAKIPVLGQGDNVSVDIIAGIRNNGLTFSAKEYPFYKTLSYEYNFVSNELIQLDPEFEYVQDVKFEENIDFEGTNAFNLDLDEDPRSTVSFSEETPYGSTCGKIDVILETIRFEQATLEVYPTDVFTSSQVYLELDYKCDIEFIIGYIGHNGSAKSTVGVITLFESDEWNKLYLDLSAELNGGRFDGYQLLLAGSGKEETGSIWIDNVRIVYL